VINSSNITQWVLVNSACNYKLYEMQSILFEMQKIFNKIGILKFYSLDTNEHLLPEITFVA